MISIEQLIPSCDVRMFMQKNGCVLSDIEKANLIYNNNQVSHKTKTDYLKEISGQTNDMELKQQIDERLNYDKLCIDRFYEKDVNYVYTLETFDDSVGLNVECGIFLSAELAVICGKKFRTAFSVFKKEIITEEKEADECDSGVIGALFFNDIGEMESFYYCGLERENFISKDTDRFERKEVELLHPFKPGDLVRIYNHGKWEPDVCLVEMCTPYDNGMKENNGDAYIRVATVYDDEGDVKFGHEHISVQDLEYATLAEDEPKKMILLCAQALLHGHGGLNELQFAVDEYRRNVRKKDRENRF